MSRATKAAGIDRQNAIVETSRNVAASVSAQVSESVTKAVTEQYKSTVADQDKQIKQLQDALSAQQKDVRAIKTSNIVTGNKPIKVEVINSVGGRSGAAETAPLEAEHATLLASVERSKYPDAPFAAKLVVQANVPINPAKFAIRFANPLQYIECAPAQGDILFTGNVHI